MAFHSAQKLKFSLLTTSSFLYFALIVIFLLLLSRAIYNRYFHPLSVYPGPFWASITDFNKFYTINSIPTSGLHLHKKHGPIVRIAPNLLSFSDPRILPRVYHAKADKTPFYSSWIFGETVGMFQTMNHKAHAALSRVISPLFSMKATKQFEGAINDRISELCDKISERSRSGQDVDFAEYTRWYLADTYSHLAYGEPNGCVANEKDVGGLINGIQSAYPMVGTVAVLPWLFIPLIKNAVFKRLILPHWEAIKGIQLHIDHYSKMTSKRAENPQLQSRACLFDSLSSPPNKSSDKVTLDESELRAEFILFTSAALDGLAAFISPFVDNVIQNRTVYSRLMTEIDQAEKQGRLSHPIVSYDETTTLPYFMACIQESLRFESPAQTILPRYISQGGLYVNGRLIPAGTEMAASPFIMHRNKMVFGDDAETFRPERWLESEGKNQLMLKYGMWWGYGDRRCTGRYLAQIQMQKLCLEIFRRFDVQPKNEEARFVHKRWAVGMFWNQDLIFRERQRVSEKAF